MSALTLSSEDCADQGWTSVNQSGPGLDKLLQRNELLRARRSAAGVLRV
jgi:hypothetical protein